MNNNYEEPASGGETLAPEARPKPSGLAWLGAGILAASLMLSGTWLYLSKGPETPIAKKSSAEPMSQRTSLGVSFNTIGKQLVDAGVIDLAKFERLYAGRGGVPEDIQAALQGEDGELVISNENSGALLNVLWALGLAEESPVLTDGPMTDPGAVRDDCPLSGIGRKVSAKR